MKKPKNCWRDRMDSNCIGVNIKRVRKEKRLSQSKVGELIGKSESTIGNYENGIIDIPCSVLLNMAEALECEPEVFLGAKVDDFNPIAELRIYTQEDRQIVAGILVKNGYTVRQIKVPREKGKSNYLCLQVKLEESSLESQ